MNGDNKPVEDYVLANVLTEFTDTSNIVLGHNFVVYSVVYTTIGSGFVVNIQTEQEIDEADIKELLICIFNGGTTKNNYVFEGLDIDESLSYDTLVNAFTSNFDMITSVGFTLNGSSFTELKVSNTALYSHNKVLRIDTDNITINQTTGG